MYDLPLSARISLLSSTYNSDQRTINADIDDDDCRDDHGVQKYMRMFRSIVTLFTAGIHSIKMYLLTDEWFSIGRLAIWFATCTVLTMSQWLHYSL